MPMSKKPVFMPGRAGCPSVLLAAVLAAMVGMTGPAAASGTVASAGSGSVAAAEKASRPVMAADAPGPGQAAVPPAGDARIRLLVAHPVVAGLARQLLAGSTRFELVPVVPARLPAGRIPALLAGRGQQALLAEAVRAEAVLSLRSVWPDDQLYPLARRANIRLIEIDVANPVEGDLPGISLLPSEDAGEGRGGAGDDGGKDAGGAGTKTGVLFSQPWQDPANLARMAALMADALARLEPAEAGRLQANRQAIAHRLQQAQAAATARLARADDVSVLLLSPRLQVLAAALQLEPLPWQPPARASGLAQALDEVLAGGQVRVVLAHARLDEALAARIEQAGARLVVLSENAADPVAALVEAMQAVSGALAGQ